jgi:transposase-like protein
MTCPDPDCACHDEVQPGRVVTHGFYTTRAGKRRRYRCCVSGKTFCSTKNTPYYRLQHRRATFDEVAALSVEGVNKSAISRVKSIAWNTVHRWLERAAIACRRFNENRIEAIEIVELQADEIRTFVGAKRTPVWIFAVLVIMLGSIWGIGKAAVYKHIPDYFPEEVGVVGGMVGVLGGLGGFFCPIIFGYLLKGTGLWTSCWMFMFFVSLVCLIWMHRVVVGIMKQKHPETHRLIE